MTSYRVSADIGGTFTDIVVEPSDGPTFVGKVETTPENPAEGVINGIKDVVPDVSDISFFVISLTGPSPGMPELAGHRF